MKKYLLLLLICFITSSLYAQFYTYNWSGQIFGANETQSKRFVIGRVYYNTIHWGTFATIKFELTSRYFSSGRLEYIVQNEQSGARIYCISAYGKLTPFTRMSLGLPVSTGTFYAGGENMYRDIYLDADYYTQWLLKAEAVANFQMDRYSINGDEYALATLFSSPQASNISSNQGDVKSVEMVSGNNNVSVPESLGIGLLNPENKLDVRIATTDGQNGPILSSYPIASFINNGSTGGKRGLQIGAPTGSIVSPVFLKVTGTSNRFAILNENNQEQFTLLGDGRMGIGIHEPKVKFHLHESISPDAYIHLTNQTTGMALGDGLEISSNGDLGANIWNYESGYLRFATGNTERMRISAGGYLGIGTSNPSELLTVNGNIKAKKLIVSQAGWPDYVFAPQYELKPLSAVESFIKKYKHLPDVPTEEQISENGLNVGDTQVLLLRKIEELTLYVIELKKELAKKQDKTVTKKNRSKLKNLK